VGETRETREKKNTVLLPFIFLLLASYLDLYPDLLDRRAHARLPTVYALHALGGGRRFGLGGGGCVAAVRCVPFYSSSTRGG
jgi:hypothetical protein